MLIRLMSFLTVLLLAVPAFAACNGTDLRQTLTANEKAALDAELTGAPYAVGNHWRAIRDGKTIHLIGTMHLSDGRLNGPAMRLRRVVSQADLLLLEMTSEDEDALESRLASDPSFLLMSDTSLPDILPEDTWNTLSNALSARGIPPFVAARFQPWYVSIVLAIPPCASLDELSGGGLDARLEDVAKRAGVRRQALENVETIFAAFADQPRDIQIEMMLSALVEPQVSEDLFATLLASYFEEATAESWAMSAVLAERYSPIDAAKAADIFHLLEQELLVDRNRAWIPVILSAAERNDTIVAAFGAAHLPGETGVLKLLEDEGFVLERLPF